ncbi:MAG TPA: hypothetical protein VFL55_18390 [Acetobacteraceae bacterium]|nr:hypothetical protein [Acetobacteraceae bacterium]
MSIRLPLAVLLGLVLARATLAADAPVIDAIVDAASGTPLWQATNPSTPPALKPGQSILLRGHGFGPGPVTAATPGLAPPAGGVPAGNGATSVVASAAEPPDRELSRILFGHVRAMERNLSSYRARIDLDSAASAALNAIQGRALDYFVEDYDPAPDTWVADIATWSDTEISLTVPITAYEGPIEIVRIPLAGDAIRDIRTGAPLRYRDPNTARVINTAHDKAFVDGWQVRRAGAGVLVSNAVPVSIATGGDDRLRILPSAAATHRGIPSGRSASDQYAYGERAFWAWDWNLALPHFLLGVDWDGIFGFGYQDYDPFIVTLIQKLKYQAAGIERPAIEPDGYRMPLLAVDGSVRETVLHKAMIDRITGSGIRPYSSFGAVPLLPETGADKVIAPASAFAAQTFSGQTPYPIEMALHLPLTRPVLEGTTQPTGWVGYVRAEAADPVPGQAATHSWIGFNCAACHSARVSYEYEPGGKRISRIFAGIPNPDWKASFLALSGRTFGLTLPEKLPDNFIRSGQNGATQAIDKTLLLYNLPPGTTESTLFVPAGDPGDYANDYFFSPQAMPIITNHTPVRRALSRSELIDGFEGAYLHGEEPEGARGPMSSRSLQDLTLYVSTLWQDDELLRRIGMYRWLSFKGQASLLGDNINEGTFVAYQYPADALVQPMTFPPRHDTAGGLGTIRDAALADPSGARAMADPFAQRFPALARRVVAGSKSFTDNCQRCHAAGNANTWTNEDMLPISASGGADAVGRFFAPTEWQRSVQSIRTAILENLFWVQRRGLLSDGHVVGSAPDNMDGLAILVDPARCRAPLNADGSMDLVHASELYRHMYTIRQGADHSFRVPGAGMRFEYTTRFGDPASVLKQVAAQPDRVVTPEEARLVERHAYFTKLDDGYYYWDYQKLRREYGRLEFGLDPSDPAQRARIGGLPAAPHPWCLPDGSSREAIDDLVAFLLSL